MADKAFLNGINDYRTIGDLRGCVNDTLSFQKLLAETFGFKKKTIRTCTDSEVTKEEIQAGWKWLLKGAEPGDRLVFHFSGHGSFTNDRDGDEAEDGVDELLCLYGMDWDDPDTYLLDDELREMTKQIPKGVLVTFVLDCCHSGTGTRSVLRPPRETTRRPGKFQSASLVDLQTSMKRMRKASPRTRRAVASDSNLVEEVLPESSDELGEASVLARFAPPPPDVIAAMKRGGTRGGFRKLATQAGTRSAESKMNHVLWSGSRSDQTSADAYIGGDYHGAFSYYFCDIVRGDSGKPNSQNVIRALRDTLEQEGFSQVPQLEPTDADDVVFQSPRMGSPGADGGGGEVPKDDDTSSPVGAPSAAIWLQIANSLQQIANQLATNVRAPVPPTAGSNRGLVYTHGICVHPEGYSKPWWDAMSPHLRPDLRTALEANRHEVLWSKHVSPTDRAAEPMDAAEAQQQQELEQRLRDVLRDRASHEVANEIARSGASGARGEGARAAEMVRAMPRAALGIPGLDCIDDFSKYLASDHIRALVLDEFRSVVRPMLARGESIDVISHSWGTVVAYEGLRSLDSESLPGRVHAFFTVGAALSISFVADRLRPSDGRKPAMVDRWINIDAKADFVGGSLQAVGMRVDQEFLDLHPTDCDSFGWPLKLYSPACAHSSYFKDANLVVNRDIFAAAINTGTS